MELDEFITSVLNLSLNQSMIRKNLRNLMEQL